jgi:hypothetical protein
MIKKQMILIVVLFLFLIRVSYGVCDSNFLIQNEKLPMKNQFVSPGDVLNANSNNLYLNGEWFYSRQSTKCPSYSISTIIDWFHFQTGVPFGSYNSYLLDDYELGFNPRILEEIYNERVSIFDSKYGYSQILDFYLGGDPVTQEPVLYPGDGFIDILINPPIISIINDTNIIEPSTNYFVNYNDLYLLQDYSEINSDLFDCIKNSIDGNNIVLGVMYGDDLTSYAGIHHIAIVGYKNCDGAITYYGHDSDGLHYLREINEDELKYIFLFTAKSDWPTYRHDNRRTGFTLLKGDMEQSEHRTLNKRALGMSDNQGFSRPSVAEIYGNDDINEIVTAYTDGTTPFLEITGTKDFSIELDSYTSLPPTIGDVNGDGQNDIIVSTGSSLSIFTIENGRLVKKMLPLLETKNNYCSEVGYQFQGYFGGTAISDIDNNGINNIISADETYLNCDAFLYNFEIDEDWNIIKQQTTSIGNVGVDLGSAVAIANLDSDTKQEVVVPTVYGIKIYKLNSFNQLTKQYETQQQRVSGTPVIYDIDRDNLYEIIYPTSDVTFDQSYTSENAINIIKSDTTEKKIISLDYRTTTAVGIANLDQSDSSLEIVVVGYENSHENGFIKAYDYETGEQEWKFPPIGTESIMSIEPNIADMDGDGDYEIIVATSEKTILMLNGNDGSIFDEITINGEIGSSPAIGAISDKGVAELTIKHSGSPYEILTTITGLNHKPKLSVPQFEITALEGEIINLNQTGEINAEDEDDDSLTISYSYPFNETGMWLADQSGEYSVLVQAFDGNLTTSKYINVYVFNETKVNSFDDNTTSKILEFNQSQNITINILLDPNKIPEYAAILMEGDSQ